MPLRRALALLVALALLAASAFARAGNFERGVFWEVVSPDGRVGHLLGTLHASDPRVLRLPEAVAQALEGADRVATELVGDEASARRFRRAMMMREPRLPALLGADDFARVENLLARSGVRYSARARMKPWAALLVLGQPAGAQGPSMDEALLAHVREVGKPVVPLESIDEQIDTFEGVPEEAQVQLLRHAGQNPEANRATIAPLIEAYLARNLAEMFRINDAVLDDQPQLRPHNMHFLERVLFARNRRFVERLEPLLRQGRVFAAFGALHLFGDRGVLSLLEQRGFRLRRLD
ncbi:MAG: TraB/GumN family protein [Rhodocyclaceae bacterium]|nr:TraB/GumN family protein [Rhodocyclaceae bacterium]